MKNVLDFISRLLRGGDVAKNAKGLAKQETQKQVNKTFK